MLCCPRVHTLFCHFCLLQSCWIWYSVRSLYRDGQNKGKLECVIDKSWEWHRLCMLCAYMSYCLCAERQESERERVCERDRQGVGGWLFMTGQVCAHITSWRKFEQCASAWWQSGSCWFRWWHFGMCCWWGRQSNIGCLLVDVPWVLLPLDRIEGIHAGYCRWLTIRFKFRPRSCTCRHACHIQCLCSYNVVLSHTHTHTHTHTHSLSLQLGVWWTD